MTDDQVTGASEEPTPDLRAAIWVVTRDAAKIHGVADRTIRKWITAGRVEAQMVNDQWWVAVTPDQAADAGLDVDALRDQFGVQPTDGVPATMVLRTSQASAPAPAVDMTPMADMIERLSQRNAELAAEAARWQERARTAEQQLEESRLALAATIADTENPGIATTQHDITKPLPWWKRLLGIAE